MFDAIVLLRPHHDYPAESARKRCAEPLLNFARQLGKTGAMAADLSSASPAAFWFEDDGDKRELRVDPIIERMQAGDTCIVRSLKSLADDPLALLAGLRLLVSRGVGLYVLSLQSSIVPFIEVLAEAAALSGDLQKRVDAAELAAARAKAEADRESFEVFHEAFARLWREGKVPTAFIEKPPAADEDGADVGAYLRKLRQERTMTQVAVASNIGLTQGQISSLETIGRGAGLARLVRYLDPNYRGDPYDRTTLKKRAAEVLRQPATHGWRPASSTVIAADGERAP